MANITDIHSIIVPAQNANLTAHTYTEIYGGSAGCTMTLNGQTVVMGSSSNIKVWVRTISGGTGCFLMGEEQDVFQGNLSTSGNTGGVLQGGFIGGGL